MMMNETRDIASQLADIIEGRATVEQIVAEGVHSYAVKYYEPNGDAERKALHALQAAAKAPVAQSKPVELVRCSCGHDVPKAQVMSSSTGSSCPDCYDRMSE